jgi:hypothetical protein
VSSPNPHNEVPTEDLHPNQFASAALVLLSMTLLGVFALVTNVLFGTALTICTSAVYLLAVSTLWLALPLQTRRHPPPEPKSSAESPPSLTAVVPK